MQSKDLGIMGGTRITEIADGALIESFDGAGNAHRETARFRASALDAVARKLLIEAGWTPPRPENPALRFVATVTPIRSDGGMDPVARLFMEVRDAALSGEVPLAMRIATLDLIRQELLNGALEAIHGGGN